MNFAFGLGPCNDAAGDQYIIPRSIPITIKRIRVIKFTISKKTVTLKRLQQKMLITSTDLNNIAIGDSIDLECNLLEDTPNLSFWKIRCEIWDGKGNSIKKATLNSGGSNTEIYITSTQQFYIYIGKNETNNFDLDAEIEIEVETPDEKIYTPIKTTLQFVEQRITWSTP